MALPGVSEIEPKFRCITEHGQAMRVTNIPNDFFKQETFQSGKTKISFISSSIRKRISSDESEDPFQHGVIDIVADSAMIVKDNGRSRIERVSSFAHKGDIRLAVIRVSDEYLHSPDHTADQISDKVFGTHGDPVNLVRDYYLNFSSTRLYVDCVSDCFLNCFI